ncbi:hypothetical protein [Cupriavidus sp. H39]|uniref:hypothetical protein n=1 Tax=Cupriavidus sp. H39 TaxID=3401635 RepID=UPI003D03F580
MGRLTAAVFFATAIITSPVWAQTATGAPAKAHDDHLVQMRQDILAARKEYKRKVAEAQNVFDQQKAGAAKERDAAIAAARATAGQK